MSRSPHIASALALLLASCPPVSDASLKVTAMPTAIDDQGGTAAILVTANVGDGMPGTGSVTVSSAAGSLKAGTMVALDGMGTGTATFSCNVNDDTACAGRVTITAKWNDLTATTGVLVGDAGTGGGAGGGSGGGMGGGSAGDSGTTDGGTTDGGTDGGLTDGGTDAGPIDAGRPASFDAGQVWLLGTLTPGATVTPALASLAAPSQPKIAFPATADALTAQLGPDGHLYYLDSATGRLHAFVPDTYTPNGTGVLYPASPGANDVTVPTPACDGGVSGFWLKPDSTAVVYRCGTDLTYFEGTRTLTNLSGARLIALGAHGTALASKSPNNDFTYDDGGTEHLIFGFMGQTLYVLTQTPGRIREAHALPTGEFVVTLGQPPNNTEPCQLWVITADGAAARMQDYAGLPGSATASLSTGPCTGRIDSALNLYTPATSGTDHVVAFRPVFPANASIVYSETGAPPSSFATNPPNVFTFVDTGSSLVTGP